MNRLIKNLFKVMVIALLVSLAMTTMSRVCLAIPCGTCRLVNSEVICADPNEPGDIPEMTPNYLSLNVITQDSNEPDPMPEMVPNSLGLNVISQDPNEEPAEMVSNI